MASNLNIFQRRAAARDQEKFQSVINTPTEEVEINETIEETPKNIFQRKAEQRSSKPKSDFSFAESALDVSQQVPAKGFAGLGGAYGNILDTFGLQPKEGTQLPGNLAKQQQEFSTLENIEQGKIPSVGELANLSDDDIIPRYNRLPSSNEINQVTQNFTGIGEGKTPAGRIAGRGALAVGEGAATASGLKGLIGLGASNVLGQSVRESGGPELLASAIEIGVPLATSAISRRLEPNSLTKAGKEISKIVEGARKIGLAEKEIAPLIQSPGKLNILSKVAHKGTKVKERFSNIKKKLGDSYERIKQMPEARKSLPNADQISLRKEFNDIRNELSRTLSPSPDKKAALDYIENSMKTLQDTQVSPDFLVNFWQDINKAVKWSSVDGGKKALAKLKEPISKTLKKVSPQLAEDFEITNDLYSKYANISKKLKPNLIDSIWNKAEIASAFPAGLALVTGNPYALGALASESALRILAREMLISPIFQNIGPKLVKNLNQGSGQAVKGLVNQAKEFLDRKHPNEDWSFLLESEED